MRKAPMGRLRRSRADLVVGVVGDALKTEDALKALEVLLVL
jgi:hypothetical protein